MTAGLPAASSAALPAALAFPRPAGRALLVWEGKAVPESVTAEPAALVEQCAAGATWGAGREEANRLYHGDNRAVLAHLLATGWRGRVRLVYIDPPYASGARYARRVRLRGALGAAHSRPARGPEQYRDVWTEDGYLQFMYERLLLLRELLAEDGCLWLHADHRQAHRLRLVLEEVFGGENYLNTIAWRSQTARGAKVDAFYFPYSTHYLEVFAKNRRAPTVWNAPRKQVLFSEREAAARFMRDEGGFFRTSDPGTYSFARLKALHAEGRLYAPYGGRVVVDEAGRRVTCSNGGNLGVKYYLTPLPDGRFAAERAVDNLWEDIPGLGTTPGEDVGYPTQKTEALLRRVVAASTHAGDWVLDCFAGSGTAAAAAAKLGRRWLACDDAPGALQVMRRRLLAAGETFDIYRTPDAALPDATAQAEVEMERGADGRVHVAVRGYSPAGRHLADRHSAADWRAWVDAVAVDPEHDGEVFRGVCWDLPAKRGEQVCGEYVVDAPAGGTVAVRLTDVWGGEATVTRRL